MESINQLIFGHVQLIHDTLRKQRKTLQKAYVRYQYTVGSDKRNKVNPYTKHDIDNFDDLFEDLENPQKK